MSLSQTKKILSLLILVVVFCCLAVDSFGQTSASEKRELGSKTAKDGFKNEDAVKEKFNSWQTSHDAKQWLVAMGYDLNEILSVSANKPHGEKADVVVTVATKDSEKRHGISIKLVSGKSGFNQIDKRWLRQYAKMWNMPKNVETSMRLFLGETKPTSPSRRPERMYLNELNKEDMAAVLAFFNEMKLHIVSDLIVGDGLNKADWFMVISNAKTDPRSKIVKAQDAAEFFSAGDVLITRAGNLRIGRISMQRKGGDGGRETAKMLQFKLDPTDIFEMK